MSFETLIKSAKTASVSKPTLEQLPEPKDIGRAARELKLTNPNASYAECVDYLEQNIKQIEHDLVLFQVPLGKLSIASHLWFPYVFNMSANTPEQRGQYQVIRPYWLGFGNNISFNQKDYGTFENSFEVANFISQTLIAQICEMVDLYANDIEITPQDAIAHAKQTGRAVERRYYRSNFEKSFGRSKYTYKLVKNLAEWVAQKCPDKFNFFEVPETASYQKWQGPVLLKAEYGQIKENLKSGNYRKPAQYKFVESKDKVSFETVLLNTLETNQKLVLALESKNSKSKSEDK